MNIFFQLLMCAFVKSLIIELWSDSEVETYKCERLPTL